MSVILTADKVQSLPQDAGHDVRDAALRLHIGHLRIEPSDFTDAGSMERAAQRRQTCSAPVQEMSAIVGARDEAKMTAKITRLAVARAAPSPTGDSLFFTAAHFISMCPTCKDSRSQLGYSSGGLLRRLNGNRLIEAYCVICNQFWPITAEERARLARQFEHLRLS